MNKYFFLKNLFFVFVVCVFVMIKDLLALNKNESFRYKISIATIFNNEADYFEEWIEYHLKIGVEHFYLYNDNSCDNSLEVLAPYIKKNIVEVFDCVDKNDNYTQIKYINRQKECNNDALCRAKNVSQWLAFIDLDEFIVPVPDVSLMYILNKYSSYGGICLSWDCYGTSCIKNCRKGFMTQDLLWKANSDFPMNKEVKSIIQPLLTKRCDNAHYCTYVAGYKQKYMPKSLLRLNHYYTKDEAFFFGIKIPRYYALGVVDLVDMLKKVGAYNLQCNSISEFLSQLNEVYDPLILKKWDK